MAVGLVIHFDMDSTSLLRVVAALKVPVHAEAEGSVRHALTVVMSLVRVDTEPSWAGMEEAVLKNI